MSVRYWAVVLAVLAAPASSQTTFTVTTTADAGAGSLRDAIEQANASPGLDTIAFSIDGGGAYQEIFLQSRLPYVTDPAVINGDTQGCDTSGGPCIRLDGAPLVNVSGELDGGLVVTGGGSTVHGLLFTRFYRGETIGAIELSSGGNTVTGCYFGTDRSGMLTDPDGTPGSGDELGNGFGISVVFFEGFPGTPSTGNVIGGAEAADRNVIAGSTFSGVLLQESSTTGNLVEGNVIGTNADGTAPLANGESGILLNVSASGNTLRGNVLSGNVRSGVTIQSGASANVIVGNRIGTNADGTAAVPNGTLARLARREGIGVNVASGASNRIEENLISGNLLAGVVLGFGNRAGEQGPFAVSGNTVRANLIGTALSGTDPIPNGVPGVPDVGFGVVFFAGANVTVTENTVGGPSLDDANVIAFNTTAGVGGEGPGVVGNVIDHNLIGITASEAPGSNGQVGILFRNGPSGNRVGTLDPDFEDDVIGNFIAFHPAGVALGPSTLGNEVAFNTFAGAPGAYLPVDLGLDGPTADDAGDPDEGPNRLQNTPTILSAPIDGDQVTVTYRVDTAAENAAYPLTVRFYGRVVENGVLGYVPLGRVTYETPGAEATATFTNELDAAPVIVATVTDLAGNTSEVTFNGVGVAGEAAPEAGRLRVQVGPNPTAGPMRFSLELADPADVVLDVFDALGRRVATVEGGALGAGPHELSVDAPLPAGVYVWRLLAGSRVETGRVTVAR